LDDLLLVEVLRTELIVDDYDFMLPVVVAGHILFCGTACVVIHPLILQRQSLGSKPSGPADSSCCLLFKSFAVTPLFDKSFILSDTVCHMIILMLL
jgi:hypothetical protein